VAAKRALAMAVTGNPGPLVDVLDLNGHPLLLSNLVFLLSWRGETLFGRLWLPLLAGLPRNR
jgi:hypothetical protein